MSKANKFQTPTHGTWAVAGELLHNLLAGGETMPQTSPHPQLHLMQDKKKNAISSETFWGADYSDGENMTPNNIVIWNAFKGVLCSFPDQILCKLRVKNTHSVCLNMNTLMSSHHQQIIISSL
jgi:hypothetical protein